jgi:uncharacterized protein with NRDE domain
MCILACAVHPHPNIDFILIHSREERLDRPTQAPCNLLRTLDSDVTNSTNAPCSCQFCREAPHLLCAHDLERGGTWLGLNMQDGHFVALTNYSPVLPAELPMPPVNSSTRGELVTRWMSAGLDTSSSSLDLGQPFSGFSAVYANLFSADLNLMHVSNAPSNTSPSGNSQVAAVNPCPISDVVCFSNTSFNYGISWPKCEYLQHAVSRVLSQTPSLSDSISSSDRSDRVWLCELVQRLSSILSCTTLHSSAGNNTQPSNSHYLSDQGCSHCAHVEQFHQSDCSISNCFASSDIPSSQRFVKSNQHRIIFFPQSETDNNNARAVYGTRAQTIVLRLIGADQRTRIYFLYRDLDTASGALNEFNPADWRFRCLELPTESS